MEVTAFAGLPTVLFLNPPTPEQLAQFADRRVIGIAGIARSQSPAWMDRHLPPVFELLRSLGAPITHYKVCSTFDSAPHVGSIGRAIDIGAPILGGAWQPVVVGDPGMGRYQAFGYLFAVANGVGYPARRAPGHVAPSGHADGRRQPWPALGQADHQDDWADRLRHHEAKARRMPASRAR